MKKYLISILCILIWFVSSAQTFDPTKGTVSNKPYSPAQSVPTDARAYFYDAPNFLWRPYQNPTEVLTFLNLPKYRGGNVIYVVDSGGTLNSNGTYTNFHATFYMFADGTADVNLIKLNLTTPGGGSGIGTVTNVSATNGSGVTFTITNPTTTPNISVVTASGGDVSGALNNITVNKFNGQLPSFYLNYNNLFNTPTIPAQLNPSCVGCSITGSYPNLTWTVTGSGFTTAGVDLIALSSSTVGLDTLNYRKVDSVYGVNDSTFNYVLNGVTHTIQVRGGNKGGGGGTGTVTVVTGVNANGVSFSITNPTSTPAITITLGAITPSTVNGLTLTAAADGFTIQGGTVSRTLTVTGGNATVRGTNTGDVTLAGENYITIAGQAITANAVNVSGTNITGVLKASAFPALTGPVTTSAGSLATSVTNNAITNAMLAQMGAQTIKGNATLGTANAVDLTQTQFTALVNTFTTTLNGSVPAPGSISGLVLSDAGTWVANGTGSTNTSVGGFFAFAVNGTNNIKSAKAGFGVIIDSLTSNVVTFKVDTSLIAIKGIDSIFVVNAGPANSATVFSLGFASGDTIKIKKLVAGANLTFTQISDSSVLIDAGGGGSGITTVGAYGSQALSTNGAVISASSIFFQSADATHPGMVSTVSQTIAGAKTYSSAPTFTTLTTNGGVLFTNASGTVTQTGAGIATQVLHGGTVPSYGAVSLTTDVSGILPIINGGNGTSTPSITNGTGISITGSWGGYTISAINNGTVTSINVSGGSTGLSFTGGPITTSGTISMTGTLIPADGGTGLSSYTTNAPIVGGSTATGTLQQVSNGTEGQVLTYHTGAIPTWTTVSGGGGGGSTADSIVTITIGSSSTVTNGFNVVIFNPTSTLSTYTLTLPTTWHSSNDLYIYAGGTLTSGTVVTNLTVTYGSAIIDDIPVTTLQVGHIIRYHKLGSVPYRVKD